MIRTIPVPPYVVHADISPARPFPHVSVDSPGWCSGKPAELLGMRVLRDHVDVTDELSPVELLDLEREVCRVTCVPSRSGVACGFTSLPPQPPSFITRRALAIGMGILRAIHREDRTQMQIDWRKR